MLRSILFMEALIYPADQRQCHGAKKGVLVKEKTVFSSKIKH
jgi:hypothetical protein